MTSLGPVCAENKQMHVVSNAERVHYELGGEGGGVVVVVVVVVAAAAGVVVSFIQVFLSCWGEGWQFSECQNSYRQHRKATRTRDVCSYRDSFFPLAIVQWNALPSSVAYLSPRLTFHPSLNLPFLSCFNPLLTCTILLLFICLQVFSLLFNQCTLPLLTPHASAPSNSHSD